MIKNPDYNFSSLKSYSKIEALIINIYFIGIPHSFYGRKALEE